MCGHEVLQVSSATSRRGTLTDYDVPTPDPGALPAGYSATAAADGGTTTFTFVRPLNGVAFAALNLLDVEEDASLAVSVAWNSRTGSDFDDQHGAAEKVGSVPLVLFPTSDDAAQIDVEPIGDPTAGRRAHAIFMGLAWLALAPTGIFTARFLKVPGTPMWFKAHRAIMGTVVLFTITGFIIAVVTVADSGRALFGSTHGVLGLVVLCLAVLQPVNAALRPHPEPRSEVRVGWEAGHSWAGRVAAILAMVNCLVGALLWTSPTDTFFIAAWAIAVTAVLATQLGIGDFYIGARLTSQLGDKSDHFDARQRQGLTIIAGYGLIIGLLAIAGIIIL
jgi:hypothetical protein